MIERAVGLYPFPHTVRTSPSGVREYSVEIPSVQSLPRTVAAHVDKPPMLLQDLPAEIIDGPLVRHLSVEDAHFANRVRELSPPALCFHIRQS